LNDKQTSPQVYGIPGGVLSDVPMGAYERFAVNHDSFEEKSDTSVGCHIAEQDGSGVLASSGFVLMSLFVLSTRWAPFPFLLNPNHGYRNFARASVEVSIPTCHDTAG
jgi:hypothetical protein